MICRCHGVQRQRFAKPRKSLKSRTSRAKDLAGIEDIVGIEAMFELAHEIDRAAEFLLQKRHLALAYAVFSRAGAVHRERPRVQPRDEVLGNRDTCGTAVIEQQLYVKIA